MPIEDDDEEDREDTDERDIKRFDAETIACPNCGQQIYPEAFRCPHCKNLLTDDERTESHKRPLWFRLTAIVCLVMAVLWVLYRCMPSR